MELNARDIYQLCNQKQWFTCGTVRQYDMMFDFVREANICASDTEKIQKLATMIWICSDDKSEEEIFNAIYEKALEKQTEYDA